MPDSFMKTLSCLLLMVLVALGGLAVSSPILAQEGEGEAAPAAETAGGEDAADAGMIDTDSPTGRFASMWIGFRKKWEQGGSTMWALGFVALIGVVFVIDRLVSLRRGRIAPAGLATKLNQLWTEGRHGDLVKEADASGSTLGKVIAFVVEHRESPYEHLVSGAEDMALRDFEVHSRRNQVLASVGAISPLLGLMGTVFGLMGAFASIGAIGTMDDPSVLADDIGKAMVTTAAGLIIAVPSLALFFYFRSKSGQLAGVVGDEVSALMHAWFLKKGA